MVKILVFVSFPNSTIRLSNSVYSSQTAWTVYRQSLERQSYHYIEVLVSTSIVVSLKYNFEKY